MVAVSALLAAVAAPLLVSASPTQCYNWKNVKVGGGGGFIPGIVFNPSEKGLAYARTDIGGAYRLNSDDSWTALNDNIGSTNWNHWGVDAIATDPVETNRLYLAVGMYTISWDPNNGAIMRSTDKGATWSETTLPFKVGGNMPGRGVGERLAVDPHSNNILYFGARSGKGLWKSSDYGVSWAQVTSFTNVGTFKPNASDSSEYMQDPIGISWVTFDENSGGSKTVATPRIFVGVADLGSSVFVSTNSGSTWSAVAGQPTGYVTHKGVFSPLENVLYVTYSNGGGPYDGTMGYVYKYNITSGVWTNITPPSPSGDYYFGFGGLGVDRQKAGTIMVTALNAWWPDGIIWRSTDSGVTWTSIWEWAGYPTRNKYYGLDYSPAPWIYDPSATDVKEIGWMMESLVIDPFDSNHWLYGTGATILGGRDLLKWDTNRNVTIKVMANGIEETAIQDLLSPPSGPGILLSGMYDAGGFLHKNLDTAQTLTDQFHLYFTGTTDIDYAGSNPLNLVRVGTQLQELASSSDGGASWNKIYATNNAQAGTIAYSYSADIIVWSPSNQAPIRSQYTNAFTDLSAYLPQGAAIASDKRNNTVFYAGSTNQFYVSTNGATSFTATATLGSATKVYKIVPNPTVAGDVWVSTSDGLYRSTNYGSAFTKIGGPTVGGHFDLGAPKSSGAYWSIAGFFTIDGTAGVYRTDDAGVNWVRINDNYGFGAADANKVAVDYNTYGRVFLGTNGRGIFYGNPSCTSPAPTSTTSTTSTRTTSTSVVTTTSRTTTTSSTTSRTTTTSTRTTTTTSTRTTTTSTRTTTSSTTSRTTTPSTTTRTTTTSTRTTTGSGATQTHYGQCGGINWTGPTVCEGTYVCTYSNDYYSQCL